MDSVIFLVLRRMRLPLLLLLCVYSVVTVGMTLVPGPFDPDTQQVLYMDFFHAFYFVSYMGSTIGFGEIPFEFSPAQRLWVMISIYLTVIAWLYAIGSLLNLLQDEALRRTIKEIHFTHTVKHLREPFYLICGYGSTSRALVRALEERAMRAVVIELHQNVINDLLLENYPIDVPTLCADSRKPMHLLEGGLGNKNCRSVIAITNDDQVNLQIAITSKLLSPQLPVVCRVGSQEAAANMASFGTDYILNPFEVFAAGLHTTLRCPHLHMLREWFMGRRDNLLGEPMRPPRKGLWILCGYGRFGKAIYRRLKKEEGIRIIIMEANPESTGYPDVEYVIGRGTEAATLLQAHIEEAVGLVAGTDDDINNLSIVMTAHEISRKAGRKLFVVLRQNLVDNEIIFQAAEAEVLMQGNQTIADHIRVLLTTPMLVHFMRLAKRRGDEWAHELVKKIQAMNSDELLQNVPSIWETPIDAAHCQHLCNALNTHQLVRLEDLRRDPRHRLTAMPAVPLLLRRGEEHLMLPQPDLPLQEGDRILWCGTGKTRWWMEWTFYDEFVLNYVLKGDVCPRSLFWTWLEQRYPQLERYRHGAEFKSAKASDSEL